MCIWCAWNGFGDLICSSDSRREVELVVQSRGYYLDEVLIARFNA